MFDLTHTNLAVPPKMYEAVCTFMLSKYAGHVLAHLREKRDTIRHNEHVSDSYRNEHIERYDRIEEECLKYTNKARSYKTKSRKKIPFDLEGWKYLDQVCEEQILNKLWKSHITAELHFKQHETRSGVWKTHKLELQVDAPCDYGHPVPSKVSTFQHNVFRIVSTIRHELGHMTQDILSYGTESSYTGLSSADFRPLNTNPEGYQFDGKCLFSVTRIAHALRDVEFFPRLDDEIQKFLWEAKDIDDKELLRKGVRNLLTGQGLGKINKHKKEVAIKDFYWYCERQPEFFRNLYYNQKGKYQEACRRFVRAMIDSGILN